MFLTDPRVIRAISIFELGVEEKDVGLGCACGICKEEAKVELSG